MEMKCRRESGELGLPEIRAVHDTTFGDGIRRKTATASEKRLEFE